MKTLLVVCCVVSSAFGIDFDTKKAVYGGRQDLVFRGLNFVDFNQSSASKLAYADFLFHAGQFTSVTVEEHAFYEPCGRDQKVTYEMLRLKNSSLVSESTVTPKSRYETRLGPSGEGSYVLRVWIYDYTCLAPSFEFTLR